MPSAILQSFGLSKMEVEMYETLLPLGDVPMADVIKVTGRHPQVVYRLVDRLVASGLAITETRRHRKYVRAEDPNVFTQAQAEKLAQLQAAVPELKALQHRPKEATVRVARGDEAVRSLRARAFAELPPGGTYYILSASGSRFYEIMGDHFATVEQQRIKRKVRKKMLAFESQRTLLDRNENMRKYVELRYLSETFTVPTSTNIYNDVTAIQIWSADPIVITIESAEVAQSHKDYFEALWKRAKA